MKKLLLLLLLPAFFWGCSNQNYIDNITEIPLKNLEGEVKKLPSLDDGGFYVVIFYSPECPLCIDYTYSYNAIVQNWNNDNFNFYTIFPGAFYEADEIRFFRSKYNLQSDILLDRENKLATAFNAKVTPEVFVIDNSGKVLYSGAIDNRMPELGVRRTEITEFYLKSTLKALSTNEQLKYTRTEAVGCLIEF
ncbi:MAG: hypothetical protein EA412_11125 [Chitinophagaceae bacterium]|nr:MAG: hypothetical protein EA412_11125 [Chitinophagaceae bacterium]